MSVLIYGFVVPNELVTRDLGVRGAWDLDGFDDVFVTWEYQTRPSDIFDAMDDIFYWPYPIQGGLRGIWINKAWDTVIGQWVRWETRYADVFGAEYPHPANWGSVSGYGVEHIGTEIEP